MTESVEMTTTEEDTVEEGAEDRGVEDIEGITVGTRLGTVE